MNGVDPKVLADYVATANNPKYNGDYNIINSKFPELAGYDKQLLLDYVATANNPNYKGDFNVINSKFPEFFTETITPQQVEQKKNQPVPQPQTTKPTQTNNMGGSQTPSPSYDFNSYFGSVVDALPEEKKSLLFRPKQAAAVEAYKKVPEATKEKMQPIIAKSTEYKDYELRQDGKTPKGTGWFGVLKTPDGKYITEYTISFTVDGKDVEVPTLNPYLTKDEVDSLVKTGEVTDEIADKTLQWYKDRTKAGKDVFISEGESIVDIGQGTIKATSSLEAIPIEDIQAATFQPNPYPLGTTKSVEYANKVAAAKQSQEEINRWIIQTTNPSTLESYTINDYFQWQRTYQKEMEENMPYLMDNFNEYMTKTAIQHPEWTDKELNDAANTYWNMFTAKQFENLENNAWGKFVESSKTSMKDATIPQKLDYLLSSVTSNTIVGNFSAYSKAIIDASIDAVEGGEGNVGEFYRENMGFVKENRSKYKDLSTVQEITETAILLSADMPVFNILGAGASAVTNYGWRAASEVATIMGVPANVAKIAAIQSGLNIAKAGVNTGVLLGSYDTLLAIGDKLSTTKVSELDSNDYKDFVNSFNKGAVAGMAVGVFSGITHSLLQKMNSNAIKKLYPTVDGKVAIAATGKTPRLKLLNTGIHIGAGILEGGLIFPLSHAAIDYAKGDEEAFQNITVQSVIEDGLKFAIAIKAQQLPSIIEQVKSSNYMIDPNFRKPFENGFTYSKAELKRWGVKDIAELQIKLNDANWLTEIQKSGQVTMVDFLKVMYDSQGIMFNNKMSINESVAQTVDKKPVLVSYDKEGRVIDIAEYKTMTEAKRAEYLINEVNITDKIVSKSADLDSKAVIELNAEYEKSPEKLVAINEALLKAPSQRTASESQLLLEVNQKIDKQIKRIETERKSKEVKPKTEKEVGKENEIKPLEQTLTLNDKEYTIRQEEGKNEVYVKNEQGLLTRENNTKTIEKVLAESEKAKPREVQSEKTQAFAAKKESIPTLVGESINKVDKLREVAFAKGKKAGIKEAKTTIKTFVNDLRQVHKEVSEFLTPTESETILTQIDTMATLTDKSRMKATNKIVEILNKAHVRSMDASIQEMDKTIDKVMTTTKVDKQKKQLVGKVDKEFVDFTTQVKDASKLTTEEISKKMETLEDTIMSGTEAERIKASEEMNVLMNAYDLAVINERKAEFYGKGSSRLDKMIAFAEISEAYRHFEGKDPMGEYQKAYEKKLKILEEKRKAVKADIELLKEAPFTEKEYETQNKVWDLIDSIATSGKSRPEYFGELFSAGLKMSKRQQSEIGKLIDNGKGNTPKQDIDAISKILKTQIREAEKSQMRPKITWRQPIQKLFAKVENFKGLGEMIGAKNAKVKKWFNDMNNNDLDSSAIRRDNFEADKIVDMKKLDNMIEANLEIRKYWSNANTRLGVKEVMLTAGEVDPLTGERTKQSVVKDFDSLSYSNILYLHQLLKLESNRLILQKKYSPESVTALRNHVDNIVKSNPKLKEISDYVFKDLLDKIYKINNEQYVKDNGVDMPKFEDYVARIAISNDPRSAKSDAKGSLKPSATRVRTTAKNLQTKVNLVDLINTAYDEAIKYNSFSDANRKWNLTLRNPEIAETIKKQVENGEDIYKALEKLYEVYPVGVKFNNAKMPKFLQKAVVAKLAANLSLTGKQVTGMFNMYVDFANEVGRTGNVIPVELKYAYEFGRNGSEFVKAWKESKAIKTRLEEGGVDPHIAGYLQEGMLEVFLANKNKAPSVQMRELQKFLRKAREIQMLPVKIGDVAAMFLGSKPLFNVHYKEAIKTMSPEKAREYAMNKTYAAFARSNQSVWSHNISAFQTTGFGKMFAFYTSTIQMGQQFRSAARTLVNESSTPSERVNAVRGMAYYGVMQKAIFTVLGAASTGLVKYLMKSTGNMLGANTNPDDSWNDLMALFDLPTEKAEIIGKILELQGATQGIPIAEDVIDGIALELQGSKYAEQDVISTVRILTDIANSGVKITKMIKENGSPENWSEKDWKDVLRFSSQIFDISGFGFSTLNRYREFLTGADLIKAEAKKKESTTDTTTNTRGESDRSRSSKSRAIEPRN